uniref:Uncharacterized protein n=1 Tax=Arundo donax TaxID=35708 RepID=A0A0A8XQT1_ARUDO
MSVSRYLYTLAKSFSEMISQIRVPVWFFKMKNSHVFYFYLLGRQ